MNLPPPDIHAAEHCQKMQMLLKTEIAASGGAISFERYMELVLYAPELGYYTAQQAKFGRQGDFVTAPEISPLFGQCLARQCRQINQQIQGNILEFGAGSGQLALNVLSELERLGCLPEHYYIVDVSPDLIQRQQALLQEKLPHLFSRIHWQPQIPEHFSGVVLANEVVDAMPVTLFELKENHLYERYVAWQDEQLIWALAKPGQKLQHYILELKKHLLNGVENYLSEVNVAAMHWLAQLAKTIKQGVILLIDYGFPQREYYHPDRNQGTLMCHYRHLAHIDPLVYPGLQDITAHVDFTALAQVAVEHGLSISGYTTQANFLLSCGLLELVSSVEDQFTLNQQLKVLTLPSEMGELFKVLALTKGFDELLLGFGFKNAVNKL